jgi:hypothetical protein
LSPAATIKPRLELANACAHACSTCTVRHQLTCASLKH